MLGFLDAGLIGFLVAVAVWYGPALADDERRALHDRLCNTRVVEAGQTTAARATTTSGRPRRRRDARRRRSSEVRRATAADAPRLAALVIEGFATYRAFAPQGWVVPALADELERVAATLAKPSCWCELADDVNGRLAGHVGFLAAADSRLPDDEPGLGHFWQLFVRRDLWGSGLATTLHTGAMRAAADRNLETLRLFTPAGHARGRRFYEREGWSLHRELPRTGLRHDARRVPPRAVTSGCNRRRSGRKLVVVQEGEHRELMIAAIATEGDAHTALLAGDHDAARAAYARAAEQYRASWALAPPKSYGRLVGLLKAAVLAGQAARRRRRGALRARRRPRRRGLAGRLLRAGGRGADRRRRRRGRGARRAHGAARRGVRAHRRPRCARSPPATPTPTRRRSPRSRPTSPPASEHLTGVAIADTAVMLELIARERGMAVKPSSPLVPAI